MVAQSQDENSLYQEFMEQIDIHMDSDPDESYPSSDISTFFQLIDKIGEQQKARQAEMEKKTAEDTEMDDASMDEDMDDKEMEEPPNSEDKMEEGYLGDDEDGPSRARIPNWFLLAVLRP